MEPAGHPRCHDCHDDCDDRDDDCYDDCYDGCYDDCYDDRDGCCDIVIMIVMVVSMTRKVTKWHVSGSDGPLLLHHLLASELLHRPPIWNDWKALPRILKTFCNISQSLFQQFSILILEYPWNIWKTQILSTCD